MAEIGWRRGLIALAGMAAGVAFVGALIVLVLNAGSGEVEVPPPPAADDTPATTVARSETAGDTSVLYPGPDAERRPLPPMGIPTIDFDWTVTELQRTSNAEVWLAQLVEVDDTLWAIGGGWDPATSSEYSLLYTSADGVEWVLGELPAGIATVSPAMVTATDAGIVAIANTYNDDEGQRARVLVSPDGASWGETDLSALVGLDLGVWISGVAGGDGVILVAGGAETRGPVGSSPSVITIEKDGYAVELDQQEWTFVVRDGSGRVVAEGSQEQIWTQEEEGLAIYDPDRGEVVMRVDWVALDRAGVAAYESVRWGAPLVIELTSADRTLILNESDGTFEVRDPAGSVLHQGRSHDLWQGLPPTFTDPATGEVLVVIPWDEWEEAHAAAYSLPEAAYTSRPVLLRSADGGATWADVDIEAATDPGFFVSSIVHGPGGFLMLGGIEPVYSAEGRPLTSEQPRPRVLQSPDGVTWSELSTNLAAGSWIHSFTVGPDGYLAVMGDEDGSRVVASPDGATWTGVLSTVDLRLEFGNMWFNQVVAGGGGTFVMGSYDGWEDPATQGEATISRDGRTLTITGPRYEITDDASGEVLASFDESDYWHEEPAAGPSASPFHWGQGGLAMFDEDRTVIFAASHREFEQANIWGEPAVVYESEQVLLQRDGDRWVRVALPAEIDATTWLGGLVVRDDDVVLIATAESHGEGGSSVRNLVLVGRPR